ncbi:MAG: SGNH/GDSL hydrolase family protein [Bacteroidota bacterium]
MLNLKYFLGVLLHLPLLPLMYFEGKRIKRQVPDLPEAKDPAGLVRLVRAGRQIKLLVIGESTIAGIGVQTHEEGFSGSLAKALGRFYQAEVDWKVYAKSGYAVKRIREEIVPMISEKEADLIVLGIGGNDAFELNTPWGWNKEVKLLLQKLRGRFPKTPIVFCNMPPIKSFPAFTPIIKSSIGNLGEIFGQNLAALIKDWPKVYYHAKVLRLDSWNAQFGFDYTPDDYFSDGVHPSKIAYQTWAQDIADMIKSQNILQEDQSIGK